MTNKELYEMIRSNDADALSRVLPNHYIATKSGFVLNEGKTRYATKYDIINNSLELDKWYINNYKLSGRYSDGLIVTSVPNGGHGLRLEIRNRKIVGAIFQWGSVLVDVLHNIHLLNNVPIVTIPADDGYIEGVVVSSLPVNELYGLITASVPDERILSCSFVVVSAFFPSAMFDTMVDIFTSLKIFGFKIAYYLETTIPKWNATIESMKLVAGGYGYNAQYVMTSYNEIKMNELLLSKNSIKWAMLTEIAPTAMFEVVGISWDTDIVNGKVRIIPVITFKYNSAELVNTIIDSDISVDPANYVIHKRLSAFKTADIDKYCVGDIFSGTVNEGKLVLSRRVGSKNIPRITPGCPRCNMAVHLSDEQVFCVNPRCPSVVLNNIRLWMSKFCPSVDDYQMVEFIKKYEIHSMADIYMVADNDILSEYAAVYDGVVLSRTQPVEFLKILMPFLSDKECNEIMMSLWVSSMDIDRTFTHMFSAPTLARLEFSPESIEKIVHYFDANRTHFLRTMRYYSQRGSTTKHPIYRRTFYITGLLYDKDRVKYEHIINTYYGRVVRNYGPHITGFIYGKYVDSDMLENVNELAATKGITIYTEEQFNKIIEEMGNG